MDKKIYLAGGCFWGTEQYLQNIKGVLKTEVGYANGNTTSPNYEQVCHENTGHAEAVEVQYDSAVISLPFILGLYYDVINPTSVNRQGGDKGSQYRTGIYYVADEDKEVIEASVAQLQTLHEKPIAIEILPLQNYSSAEERHQKYLVKHPDGYCHIGTEKFELAKIAVDKSMAAPEKSRAKTQDELKRELTPLQFEVTQNSGTEPPFCNEFYNHFEKGIYVDILTGEALFASAGKFESGCGWPAFSAPISNDMLEEKTDKTHGMYRTEVRSKGGNSHLGHVFEDGPKEQGGLRYCINSASLRFIPKSEMAERGYGQYLEQPE